MFNGSETFGNRAFRDRPKKRTPAKGAGGI